MTSHQEVLCLPRSCTVNRERFTPWKSADWLVDAAESGMTWLPRPEAEVSHDYVQPIPCALVLGRETGYHVFRRIKGGRADLSSRLTLVVGGHIDFSPVESAFNDLLSSTLRREIKEELNVSVRHTLQPVGVVIDQTSLSSSRHIGVVREMIAEGPVTPVAEEEFALHSKYAGHLCEPGELASLSSELDPWSSILFNDFVATSFALDAGLQLPFRDFAPALSVTTGRQIRLL